MTPDELQREGDEFARWASQDVRRKALEDGYLNSWAFKGWLARAALALPKDPPPGLLMSMAIRYDQGLGVPGHYDDAYSYLPTTGGHKRRLESTLTIMRQLYEEVSGHGFYRPERAAGYVAMQDGETGLDALPTAQPSHPDSAQEAR